MADSAQNSAEPQSSPPTPRIDIRILSPGSGVPETIDIQDVPVTTTIGALKERVNIVGPSHPPTDAQRLIYQGHVLANPAATLNDVFGAEAIRSNRSFTIHLVVRQPGTATPHPPSRPASRTATPQNGSARPPQGTHAAPQAPQQQNNAQPFPFAPRPVMPQMIPGFQFPQIPGLPPGMGLPGMGMPGMGVPGMQAIPGMPGFPQQWPQGLHPAQQMMQPQPAPQGHPQQDNNQGSTARAGQPTQGPFSGSTPRTLPLPQFQRAFNGQQRTPATPATPNIASTPGPELAEQTFNPGGAEGNQQQHAGQEGQPVDQQSAQVALGQPEEQARTQQQSGQPQAQQLPNQQQHGQQAIPAMPPNGVRYQMTVNQTTFAIPQAHAGQIALPQQQPQAFLPNAAAFQYPGHPQFPQQFLPHAIANQVLMAPQGQAGMQPQPGIGIPGLPPFFQAQLPAMLSGVPANQGVTSSQPGASEDPLVCLLYNGTGPAAVVFHQGSVYRSRPQTNASQLGMPAVRRQPSPLLPNPTNLGNTGPPEAAVQQVRGMAQAARQELERAQPGQNQAQQQQNQGDVDLLGPIQPLLTHLWLLFRILFFVYFFLGGSMGWRKPLILVAISVAFFVLRGIEAGAGLRNAVRGWWEGVAGLPPRREQGQDQNQVAPGAQQAIAPGQQRPPQALQQNAVAPANNGRNDEELPPWRRTIRPLERALPLFVASLWPGVGERTIRARRDEEERQRREQREREERERAESEARNNESTQATDPVSEEVKADGPSEAGPSQLEAGVEAQDKGKEKEIATSSATDVAGTSEASDTNEIRERKVGGGD